MNYNNRNKTIKRVSKTNNSDTNKLKNTSDSKIIPDELKIIINTNLVGLNQIIFTPSMLSSNLYGYDKVYFNPLVKLNKNKIISNFKHKSLIFLFDKSSFNNFVKSYSTNKTDSLQYASQNDFISNNIQTILDLLFTEENVLKIKSNLYTIMDYQWAVGDWVVKPKVSERELNRYKNYYDNLNPLNRIKRETQNYNEGIKLIDELPQDVLYGSNYSKPIPKKANTTPKTNEVLKKETTITNPPSLTIPSLPSIPTTPISNVPTITNIPNIPTRTGLPTITNIPTRSDIPNRTPLSIGETSTPLEKEKTIFSDKNEMLEYILNDAVEPIIIVSSNIKNNLCSIKNGIDNKINDFKKNVRIDSSEITNSNIDYHLIEYTDNYASKLSSLSPYLNKYMNKRFSVSIFTYYLQNFLNTTLYKNMITYIYNNFQNDTIKKIIDIILEQKLQNPNINRLPHNYSDTAYNISISNMYILQHKKHIINDTYNQQLDTINTRFYEIISDALNIYINNDINSVFSVQKYIESDIDEYIELIKRVFKNVDLIEVLYKAIQINEWNGFILRLLFANTIIKDNYLKQNLASEIFDKDIPTVVTELNNLYNDKIRERGDTTSTSVDNGLVEQIFSSTKYKSDVMSFVVINYNNPTAPYEEMDVNNINDILNYIIDPNKPIHDIIFTTIQYIFKIKVIQIFDSDALSINDCKFTAINNNFVSNSNYSHYLFLNMPYYRNLNIHGHELIVFNTNNRYITSIFERLPDIDFKNVNTLSAIQKWTLPPLGIIFLIYATNYFIVPNSDKSYFNFLSQIFKSIDYSFTAIRVKYNINLNQDYSKVTDKGILMNSPTNIKKFYVDFISYFPRTYNGLKYIYKVYESSDTSLTSESSSIFKGGSLNELTRSPLCYSITIYLHLAEGNSLNPTQKKELYCIKKKNAIQFDFARLFGLNDSSNKQKTSEHTITQKNKLNAYNRYNNLYSNQYSRYNNNLYPKYNNTQYPNQYNQYSRYNNNTQYSNQYSNQYSKNNNNLYPIYNNNTPYSNKYPNQYSRYNNTPYYNQYSRYKNNYYGGNTKYTKKINKNKKIKKTRKNLKSLKVKL